LAIARSQDASRRRLSPEESRHAALEAARDILIAEGPQAVTLKAVSAAIGRTHANLLHHFGSVAELHEALARHICARVCAIIEAAMVDFFSGLDLDSTAARIADLTFDAFEREGAGELAAWMMSSGRADSLDPLIETIADMTEQLQRHGAEAGSLRETTLHLTLMALGHSIMGRQLCHSLGLPPDMARTQARRMLVARLEALRPRA
jgi:AcrR family transcriptional regulator